MNDTAPLDTLTARQVFESAERRINAIYKLHSVDIKIDDELKKAWREISSSAFEWRKIQDQMYSEF